MIILPAKKYNLACPARRAGFVSSHIASGGAYASFVPASGGLLVDCLHPVEFASNNTNGLTNKISRLGRSLDITSNFKTVTYTGYPTKAYTTYTKAVIVQFTSVASVQMIIGDGATVSSTSYGAGVAIQIAAGGALTCRIDGPGVNINTGITLSAGIPYFIAISTTNTLSAGTGAVHSVVTRLDNGVTQSSVVNGTTSAIIAPTGTMSIGNTAAVDAFYIAAGMAANSFLTVPTLLMWSNHPWSFWYPNL